METITLTDAEAHLTQLIARVEAGSSITITRHGKPVARLIPVSQSRKRIDAAQLQSRTATMPASAENATSLIRSIRDTDRY